MSSNHPPGIVTPEEWIQRTSTALSARDEALRAVDRAYSVWYGATRDPQCQRRLLTALERYLESHGRFWDRDARNRASNGQMLYGKRGYFLYFVFCNL